MNLKIDIKDILYPTLQQIASANGLTPETYARNIIQTFLEKQYRGVVLDKIKYSSVEELTVLKDNKLTDLIKK